jgi:hypothetical protein
MLSFCYLAQGDEQAAQRAIGRILDLQPRYHPDPDLVPSSYNRVFYDVLKAQNLLRTETDGDQLTMAVFQFDENLVESDLEGIGAIVASEISGCLRLIEDIVLVERAKADYVMEEIKRNRGDWFDVANRVRAGRLVGAEILVFGDVNLHDKKLSIIPRFVRTETSVQEMGGRIRGDEDDLYELLEELCATISKEIGSIPQHAVTPLDIELKAQLEYHKGLERHQEGDLAGAMVHWSRAIEIAPDFAAAEAKLRHLHVEMAYGGAED